ncbi:ABC transporter ATP-binding protein [Nonomuraea sp. KM88]|uniref:ABC transporter ATP-binding protein n=1 Tax=Nonomuraea sp. KM88 TaxID=3457427 RepID=UPI003FCD1DB3
MTAPVTGPELTTWGAARRIGGWFRPYRRHVIGSLSLVLVSVPVSVASPLLIQVVIDEALPSRDAAALALLCGLLVALGLLGSVLAVGEIAWSNWVGQRVSAQLRMDLYDRVNSRPLGFYSERSAAETQARLISDVDGVDKLVTGTAQQALGAITSLAAAALAMAILSWPLALVSLALAWLLSLLNHRFTLRRRGLARQRQRLLTTLMRYAAEDLSAGGVLLGRTLGRTAAQRQRFAQVCQDVRDVTIRQRVTGALAYMAIGASFACVPPMIFWLAGTVLDGLSVGTVVVMALLQMRLSSPIETLLLLSGSVQAAVAKFERIAEYLDIPEAQPIDRPGPPRREAVTGVSAVLIGVGHDYGGGRRPVLDDVNLVVAAGTVTVLTGRTGSGKSTLGLVLAGLLTPARGEVLVDGAARLRDVATLVPQHTTMFSGSIRENLAFARDGVTEEEMRAVLAAVSLDSLVDAMPDGLDTPVGEDGHQLSGGERQRLAVARALLVPCGLLIVDEVTSALDGVTAEHVFSVLRRHCRDRALVVITHRSPSAEPGDRLLVVEDGRLRPAMSYEWAP